MIERTERAHRDNTCTSDTRSRTVLRMLGGYRVVLPLFILLIGESPVLSQSLSPSPLPDGATPLTWIECAYEFPTSLTSVAYDPDLGRWTTAHGFDTSIQGELRGCGFAPPYPGAGDAQLYIQKLTRFEDLSDSKHGYFVARQKAQFNCVTTRVVCSVPGAVQGRMYVARQRCYVDAVTDVDVRFQLCQRGKSVMGILGPERCAPASPYAPKLLLDNAIVEKKDEATVVGVGDWCDLSASDWAVTAPQLAPLP